KMKSLKTLFLTFLKIGAFTFGGGYAMIALLTAEFVEKKKWLTSEEFLDMVAVAESTPGPVAVNSATYIGYRIAGVTGAAVSTFAVCLPSFITIFVISLFFDQFLALKYVQYAFDGIQVCVVYLILSAGIRMLKQLSKNALNIVILTAVMTIMIACSLLAVSFSSIACILVCGAAGLAVYMVGRARQKNRKDKA
ncbi:MAG: chromate transporter, partial [Chordicoccus sp.]